MGLPFAFWINPIYIPTGYLLEDYSGAAAAYSLRKIANATTSVIKVRRSSDNTEQDFTASEIIDGTLTTFTGAGDGFVSVWYDQSGSSNNALQTTASNQPKIVSSGTVILENGKPAVKFDGSNDNLSVWNNTTSPITFQSISDSLTVLTVEKATSISGSPNFWFNNKTLIEIRNNSGAGSKVPINIGYSNSDFGFGVTDNYTSGAEIKLSATVSVAQRLSTSLIDGDDLDVFLNSVSAINTSFTTATSDRSISSSNSTFSIGARSRDGGQIDRNFYIGNVQEIIIYPSNESTNRAGIEANINTEYTIY